jgi:hypothetical protein
MVLEMLVSSSFNRLTWLAAQKSFIAFHRYESFTSYWLHNLDYKIQSLVCTFLSNLGNEVSEKINKNN